MAQRRARLLRSALIGAAFLTAAIAAADGLLEPDRLRIVAPVSPGGGWDQTARAMEEVLEGSRLVAAVEVVNSPGAGGGIGLAQFIGGSRGDGNSLLVGGLVMLRALRAHDAAVSLAETTPIARLTGESLVIVVPAASEYRTLEDLLEGLRANPGSISWAGGSLGGIDQHLAALVAQAAGVDPVRINYLPFSGGGQAAAALLQGRALAGVSGYGEFERYIASTKLRALAVSSERRLSGVDTPTLKERGLDVTVVNWRGIFAPPGLTDAQRERLSLLLDAMVGTPAWRAALVKHRWTDAYLSRAPFAKFVEEERARLGAAPAAVAPSYRPTVRALLRRHTRLMLLSGLVGLVVLASFALVRERRRERVLSAQLETAREDARRSSEDAHKVLAGLGEEIARQFQAWGLTAAEREVADLMLKGLRHKEIAEVRHTSERTVRQQALAIYKKAGLDGRTDLAAFFLEDLLSPGGKTIRHGAA